ncbi:DNA mismatch repair protein MutS [Holzapfeliella sp. He02]|uniref:DNA mismatch repair protein MutS n=1 Tax=Holzapfeliella saturejae TaxID=3082953 RepID=A0ABU8SFL0_9LACO
MAKSQTPMMKQYYEIKAKYPDAFLFYRVGDFYELFEEDAVLGAKLLELTLTYRNKNTENRTPMAGMPHHAIQNYIDSLVDKGYKVAICDQVEDPKDAQGMVKREVVQLITPGTMMDEKPEQATENNYLTSVSFEEAEYGLSYSDLATGEVQTTHFDTFDSVFNELLSLQTKEVIWSGELTAPQQSILKKANILVSTPVVATQGESEQEFVSQRLTNNSELRATKQLIQYIVETQKRQLAHLQIAKSYEAKSYLQMSHVVKQNLEITQSSKTHKKMGSLYWLMDKTKTAMGSRLLKHWLERPLVLEKDILYRQNMVQALLDDFFTREEIADALKNVYDLERLTGRVAFGNINGRQMRQLGQSLSQIPKIIQLLDSSDNEFLQKYADEIVDLSSLGEKILTAIVDDPPILVTEGSLIKEGYDQQLDEYYHAMHNGTKWLADLERQEKEATGIPSLKIGYNKVFGYYLEVTNTHKDKVPERYERKQTLSNSERYLTPELKEMQTLILQAQTNSVDYQYDLFVSLRDEVKSHIKLLQQLSHSIAALDVLTSFSVLAEDKRLVRPQLTTEHTIAVEEGRHPVVEAVLENDQYIPNNIEMDEETDIFLITGPNMSGKSTYMRQMALIAIMNQVGSFVPAASAKLPIFDKVFTRIGAADDLISGQSTFMVEMNEANQALKHATAKSLILFDEIGRGTATYDGMSLAGAIIKYLHQKVGAKTLFATHYHELTALEQQLPHLKNVHVGASEKDGKLTFLHKIIAGPADQSYGIHVAQLAGLPKEVIVQANQMLQEFEGQDKAQLVEPDNQLDLFTAESLEESTTKTQTENSNQTNQQIINEIKSVNLMNKTPFELMNLMNQWQQKLTED